MNPITPETRAELRRLCEEYTPPPPRSWATDFPLDRDTKLLMSATNALPHLLDHIDAMERELAEAKTAILESNGTIAAQNVEIRRLIDELNESQALVNEAADWWVPDSGGDKIAERWRDRHEKLGCEYPIATQQRKDGDK